jgi:hypothetical protein
MAAMALAASVATGCGGGGATDGSGGSTSASTSGATSTSTGTGSGGSGGGQAFAFCPAQHPITTAGKEVIVCDTAYDKSPFVHLPPAEAGAAPIDYMALAHCASFIDRDGKEHKLAPTAPVQALCTGPDVGQDYELQGHAFAVYRTTLDAGGLVTAFERWGVVDEKILLRPFSGIQLEGTISGKTGDVYEAVPSVPIRLTLGQPALLTDKPDGTSVYQVTATIDNLSKTVMTAGGTCMAAIAGGPKEPYPGAKEVTLSLTRIPSMHGPGDDEVILEYFIDKVSMGSAMGPMWYFGPESLFLAPGGPLPDFVGTGHGTPGSLPNLALKVVTTGGGGCAP